MNTRRRGLRRLRGNVREVAGIDTRGHNGDRLARHGLRIERLKRRLVHVRNGEDAIESREGLRLELPHPEPLAVKQPLLEPAGLGLCMPSPDLGFDVVREEHRGHGDLLRQVDCRHEEVADDAVVCRERQRSTDCRPVHA